MYSFKIKHVRRGVVVYYHDETYEMIRSSDNKSHTINYISTTEECQPSVTDVVFVLDSSVSQTAHEFNKQLDFINKFVDHVVLGIENFQIAVITYSFEAKVEIELGQYNDSVLLKDVVSNIQFR